MHVKMSNICFDADKNELSAADRGDLDELVPTSVQHRPIAHSGRLRRSSLASSRLDFVITRTSHKYADAS